MSRPRRSDRIRWRLLFRMWWLARQQWGLIMGWRMARLLERATRPLDKTEN